LRVIDARTLVQCDLKALGPALLVTRAAFDGP
jgi:hypothetical protein